MRISTLTYVSVFWLGKDSAAFTPTQFAAPRSVVSMKATSRPDLHEFDFILGEKSQSDLSQQTVVRSRRKIQLPGSPNERTTVLASSTFAAPGMDTENELAEVEEEDPYSDLLEESTSLSRYEEADKPATFGDKLKGMDAQDIITTLVVPGIFAGYGLKWVLTKGYNKGADKAEETLDAWAQEMVYHDGDFEEMRLCVDAFRRKLAWLGPKRTTVMLKRYLTLYAKKVNISPQSISSLSYAFALFGLSEEEAANYLVELCDDMGTQKTSSAGKLLFFGSRILKSEEGKAALNPIKEMIMTSFKVGNDIELADDMVDVSQRAIGEAAYRAAIQEEGKDQETLTIGWEILGLEFERAVDIWQEEAKEGFMSEREKMYGGQSQEYDAKGNKLTKDGELEDPENAIPADEDEDMEVSNVMECEKCGYVLFIAEGREKKFFGPGFRCPECQCGKKDFKPKDMEE